METMGLSFSRYFTVICFLQMVTPSSEQFTVSGSEVPILASLGGVVELSCQLFPPQSAQHMEVRWFRDRYTEPIHLYKDGKDLYGEIISKYVERTELLKEAIGEGKVTLRILNVSVEDDGQYHCFFKDSDDFYEEAVTEVKVTATSLEIQVHMHPPNTKGLLVECDSGGWFPQPQMEWRDSRGEIIPPASTTHSQDENKLFNMKMTLLLRDSSHGNVTCYLRNPVTGQEQRTSIVLSNKLFPWNTIWTLILILILFASTIFTVIPSIELCVRQRCQLSAKDSELSPSILLSTFWISSFTFLAVLLIWLCYLTQRVAIFHHYSFRYHNCCQSVCSCKKISPIIVNPLIAISSVGIIAGLISYLQFKKRVPASDPHFQLDIMWLEDMTVLLCVLMAFITMIISFVYSKIRESSASSENEDE